MSSSQDLATIEAEGRRIVELARSHPGRTVSQYPTWKLRDLAIHVASVHGRTAEICRTLPAERIPSAELPEGEDPFDWADDMLTDMVEGLRRTDPEAEVWTFGSDATLRFWRRRMVIETGVHRWDAQGALEDPDPLLAIVATHGLDEFSDMYLPRLGEIGTLQLFATDMGRSWQFGPGRPAASTSATASDLFLRLMSRPGAQLPPDWERAVDSLASPAR